MDIQISFPAAGDFEMRDDTTPAVLVFEALPRPPHKAAYHDFSMEEGGGLPCIDGRSFHSLEHHRGQTLWVWRITGGMVPKEPLQGCWAEARIETYREQCQRLEATLAAERETHRREHEGLGYLRRALTLAVQGDDTAAEWAKEAMRTLAPFHQEHPQDQGPWRDAVRAILRDADGVPCNSGVDF